MGLYEKIRDKAKAKGITISEIEADLGFSRSSIYKWNVNIPGIDRVKKVADYLGVSIEELMK
ncbi:transcriptional regulator with XRE-family HTH domain [Moryella indoligenes]|uniref:Transcriptional regulator with XRE-family HTH domain n=1 Tax=Moryella indoligenes TaxID=371674 RepID=A0AAE4AMI0_9FIRM|nr:helix-turn-helix transcriptional regulator [Moryella indoligenes]MDQ0153672.1 transcriptional regulator with XRE-family HTH domain [Moryella indoligenes]